MKQIIENRLGSIIVRCLKSIRQFEFKFWKTLFVVLLQVNALGNLYILSLAMGKL